MMRKRRHHFNFIRVLALIWACNANLAVAAGGPPMITDDPGTPGDGHWEINVASLSSRAGGATTYQLPLIDANYGVGDRLQLKYEMPWLLQDNADGSHLNGAGKGLAGVKWRFFDEGEEGWQVSTYPQIEFDVPYTNASRNGLNNSGTNYLLPLEFVHVFGQYDINLEAGRWFRSAPQQDSWIVGLAFTHEIRKGFELIAEIHEEKLVWRQQEESILNFGARWDFSENYTLLVSVGRDLRSSLGPTNTFLSYLGLQMRF